MTISWREGMDPGSIPVHHLTSVKICLLLPSRDWPIFLLYELWIKHFDIYISLDLLISQAQPRLHPEMQHIPSERVFKINTVFSLQPACVIQPHPILPLSDKVALGLRLRKCHFHFCNVEALSIGFLRPNSSCLRGAES